MREQDSEEASIPEEIIKIRAVRFSSRTNWDTSESSWAEAMTSRRQKKLPVFDLTVANPTHCGFSYDPQLLTALQQAESLHYSPEPLGLLVAREAICAYYAQHTASLPPAEDGAFVDSLTPGQIVLTASTSEAYSYLFRLLCDPGDEVLIAQPSYPLFDFLAVLDDVTLVPFSMFYDHGWHLDVSAIQAAITSRTRAVVIVHPNNPAGHYTNPKDRQTLEFLCRTFGLALIVDEVFLDYSFTGPVPSFVTGKHPVLTFVLSGLSKISGLPQMKLAWIAVTGPASVRGIALTRLEIIADTFLSVGTPAQLALPLWLEDRATMQIQIQTRMKSNLHVLDKLLDSQKSVVRLSVEGGWYAIVQAPAHESGEETALHLLLDQGVAVHPGSFFGMTGERNFVISLLPEKAVFEEGVRKMIQFLDR